MALKDRVIVKFPAIVNAATGVGYSIVNGVYTFFLQIGQFARVFAVPDTTATLVMVYTPDPTDVAANGQYNLMSIADFIGAASLKVQVITDGSGTIASDSNIVIVNQTIDGAYTLTLPLAAQKAGQVLVVDWKGNAGTYNITIVPSGSETFQGGATSWKIDGDGASTSFRPVPLMGYAI